MDWIKEHKTLSGLLGVIIAGFIALAVMLWGSYGAYGEALDAYSTTDKKLNRLESAPLYPNQENLTAKKQLVEEYEGEVRKLQSTLLNLQPPIADISETDFQAKLKQRMAETRQKAGLNEDTSRIPKNFAFGFDVYVNSLPASGTAKDLNDYLDAVDAIVQLALDSGVKKIDTLTRSDLASEKGGGAAAPAPSTTSSFVNPPSTSGSKKAASAVEPPPAQVVERRQVQMKVVADQGPLQALLNGLASASKMHYFTVVRVLRLENEKMEGPSRALAAPPKPDPDAVPEASSLSSDGESSTAEAKPAGPEVIVAPTAAPLDAVAVMGRESLHAHLEIDIIRYLPEGSTAAAGN
jgi:hypothetical protein